MADGDEGKKEGGQVSETARDRASNKAKALGIYTCEGKANCYALVVVIKKSKGEYELTIWRSNFEVMRDRSFASRATRLESQAKIMPPTNERGTAPEKTL